jgi:predicted AAA+ superfamily ATPase
MEELISYQNNLMARVPGEWYRYLFPEMHNRNRLIGIKGLHGAGKTTMFLQYLAFKYSDPKSGLYVTADHPYFYNNTMFDLASDWTKYGGKLLLIDEVHKYPNWSRELKLMYDGNTDLRIIFTSSSTLDLYRGESDLSRRLITYDLHGLSFREFLSFHYGLNFRKVSLSEILKDHHQIAVEIVREIKILSYFEEYLLYGYFPFSKDVDKETFIPRLIRIINTVLESDLAYSEEYSTSNIRKIKKLLGVIAETTPFEPNISRIAEKLQLGRNTVTTFLKNLSDAHVLNLLSRSGKGSSRLQKPDKIYFENTSFAHAFENKPEKGTIREIFFMNQLKNAGHLIELATGSGDFLVDRTFTFEVGGKNKGQKQIKDIENSYLALDQVEHGFSNKIPLWLFGFLY